MIKVESLKNEELPENFTVKIIMGSRSFYETEVFEKRVYEDGHYRWQMVDREWKHAKRRRELNQREYENAYERAIEYAETFPELKVRHIQGFLE